jgi:triosephosphate isomerase
VNKKVAAIQQHGMTPIFCCGETLEEREAGQTEAKVLGQVRAGFAGRTPQQVAASSSPTSPSGPSAPVAPPPATTPSRCAPPSARASTRVGQADAASSVRIQYGGSVKGGNIAELMAQPDIDGALVGGASLGCRRVRAHLQARCLNQARSRHRSRCCAGAGMNEPETLLERLHQLFVQTGTLALSPGDGAW